MKEIDGVVFTAITVNDLADRVAERLKDHIQELLPDEEISATQAASVLGIKEVGTILRYINNGELINYGRGNQRPRLSKNECLELKKRIVNGRLRRSE